MTKLPALEQFKSLGSGIVRILGQNPGPFTLQGTNTYLLGSQESRILVDTGEGLPEYRDQLRQYLDTHKLKIGAIVITHWHKDHTGGLNDFEGVPVYKFPHSSDPPGVRHIRDEEHLTLFGVDLKVLHTPGHTTDHICLLWNKVLVAGDNVLGHGTAVYEDYATYMASLQRMKISDHALLLPGHGEAVQDGPKRIAEYIAHRQQREQQVLATLDEPLTPQEITQKIYNEEPRVMAAAERGVRQFLAKLEKDGRVSVAGEKWSRL